MLRGGAQSENLLIIAASAASPDYVKIQAVIKSAASAASLRGGHACGRLDHDFFLQCSVKNTKRHAFRIFVLHFFRFFLVRGEAALAADLITA